MRGGPARPAAAYFLFNLRENLAVTTYFSVKTFISLVSSSRLDEKSSPPLFLFEFSYMLTSTIKVRKKRGTLLYHTYKKERKKYNSMIFILKRHL